MLIVSLAVDYGHAQLVKLQMECCADAAARAGANCLTGSNAAVAYSNALAAAIQVAALNKIDGTTPVLTSSNVAIGNYDATQAQKFLAGRSPYNAVQVTINRQASSGTAVQLMFTRVLGLTSMDLHFTSIARIDEPESTYGFAGVQSLTFGSIGVLAKVNGDMVSGGNISIGCPLGIGVSVSGNVQSANGYTSQGTMASIGGSTGALYPPLNYPDVQLPSSNNNSLIKNYLDTNQNFVGVGHVSIPAGTYVVNNLNLLATVNMDLQGPVTFYVTGSANIAASVNLLGNTNTAPSNFNVNVATGGSVNFLANLLVPIAMNLYAPETNINIAVGVNTYTGSIVGKNVNISLPVLGTFNEVKLPAKLGTIELIQ
jgi:Flp pilus assembly protein TadG